MIPVNKPYLPAFDKYTHYLERMYKNAWLTNNGPLVQELKVRLEEYLGVKNLLLVANGTLAMQLAYKVFNLSGNAVTTPFTFIATSSSLAWEGVSPNFADINPESYNLCPHSAEQAVDEFTTAIVPVHVYGNPCDVEAFQALSLRKNLKVIYDAAHAFGVNVNGTSVLNYGDASTLSFHATKIFHTVEGGAVIFKNSDDYERALLMSNFGINTKTMKIKDGGINTKLSEVHAAMGLAVLDNIDNILAHRKALFVEYISQLKDIVNQPIWHREATLNGAYMPVTFSNKDTCTAVLKSLGENGIIARRYFNPSINTIEKYQLNKSVKCEISESYAERTLCLPLYFDMNFDDVEAVVTGLKKALYAHSI